MDNDKLNKSVIRIYKHSEKAEQQFELAQEEQVEIAYQSQPFFADLDGDLKNEILYNDPLSHKIMVYKPGKKLT